MPSIANAVDKNKSRISAGGETNAWSGSRTPQSPDTPLVSTPPQDLPLGGGLPQRGMFPADLVLASDRSDSSRVFRGMGTRSATFPYQTTPQKITSTTVVQAAASTSPATTSLLLQTNNINNPNQKILNLIAGANMSISADPTGGVTLAAAGGGGDGLIHGDAIWEIDPAYVFLRDDFVNVNISGGISSFTSELPWFMANGGSVASVFASGGAFPYSGFIELSATSTPNQISFLMPVIQPQPAQFGWPVLDYPGWKMIWVFKVGRVATSSPPSSFSWSQVSNYIGFANYPGLAALLTNTSSPRPPFFLGLRYDTDTTAPSIGDTQFVFEYVTNSTATPATRVNTQGTVIPTGIIPTEGKSYRLEISCTAAGSVTLLLTDGTTSFSTPMAVTQFSTNSAPGISNFGGSGVVEAAYSVNMPWSAGSLLTISGGIKADINGTWSMNSGSLNPFNAEWYLASASSGTDTGATTKVYPAFSPFISFGNDSSLAPGADTKAMAIDFFSFVWNPGVGGGSGTPNATLPRYF